MMRQFEMLEFTILMCLFWATTFVFCRTYEKRKKFLRRISVIGVGILLYSILFAWIYGKCDGTVMAIAGGGAVALMVLLVYQAWDVHLSVAIYNVIWGVGIWQLMLESWCVLKVQAQTISDKYQWLVLPGVLVFFGIGYWIFSVTIVNWMSVDRKAKIGPRQLCSALLVFLIIEVLAVSQKMYTATEYNSDWKFIYVTQLICLVILYMQNEIFKKVYMRQELALMNFLWEKEQEQYRLARENINLINQKCHDLKHQIRALRKVSKEEFDKYLDEVEDAVGIYETIVKTGNDVFDTILTEKSLHCRDRQIQVSCVADGSQMDFIDTIDLYAILGNAMDNAIEAVSKFEDPEKRQIDVIIHRQQNFLIMNFINPMPVEPLFEDDIPVSTKQDRGYHGYGIRSIKHFVKKYDGVLNISVEDGCFSLKMMIPIP